MGFGTKEMSIYEEEFGKNCQPEKGRTVQNITAETFDKLRTEAAAEIKIAEAGSWLLWGSTSKTQNPMNCYCLAEVEPWGCHQDGNPEPQSAGQWENTPNRSDDLQRLCVVAVVPLFRVKPSVQTTGYSPRRPLPVGSMCSSSLCPTPSSLSLVFFFHLSRHYGRRCSALLSSNPTSTPPPTPPAPPLAPLPGISDYITNQRGTTECQGHWVCDGGRVSVGERSPQRV